MNNNSTTKAPLLHIRLSAVLAKVLYKKGIIGESVLQEFSNLGWQSNMKFEFYIPTISQLDKTIERAGLHIHSKEYGVDVYSPNFPIYIIKR